jgi:hypothetical protein
VRPWIDGHVLQDTRYVELAVVSYCVKRVRSYGDQYYRNQDKEQGRKEIPSFDMSALNPCAGSLLQPVVNYIEG